MPPSLMDDLLFVYGTLRRDSKNEMHRTLAGYSAYVGDGRIRGELYDLGTYPGVFLRDGCLDLVLGEVYGLSDQNAAQTWRVLDNYEGCGLLRRAARISTPDGPCLPRRW